MTNGIRLLTMVNETTSTDDDGCCSHKKLGNMGRGDRGVNFCSQMRSDPQEDDDTGTMFSTISTEKSSSCCGVDSKYSSMTKSGGLISASSYCSSKLAPAAKDCCGDENNTANQVPSSAKSCNDAMTVPALKPCYGGNRVAETNNIDKQSSNDKCCGDKSCCETKVQSTPPKSDCCSGEESNGNNSLKCIAVIHPGESTVDVFDTTGRSKTFRISNNKGNDMSGKKLCFSTHGADEDIGRFLTPCFEGSGKHAETEDGCPCGVDEQHLHAHVYDPEVCGTDDGTNCVSSTARSKATDWRFLSRLTFHLDDNNDADISYMPITASMPKVCNSDALHKQLTNKGLKLSHWLRWRNGDATTCGDKSYCGVQCKRHRLYPIQHEDHTDYLIHNEKTGDMYLEHPNCDSCGDVDIHGRFHLVHTRSWMGNKPVRINLHVFEVHEEPFHLLDLLSDLFEIESSRVHAARAVVEDSSARVGRSQFSVKGICCASEIPQVESILKPLTGVSKFSVNATTKMGMIELRILFSDQYLFVISRYPPFLLSFFNPLVSVDHDFDIISAQDIAIALACEGFESVVTQNAATANQLAGIPTDVFVKSTFDLTDVFYSTTFADRGKIHEIVQACLRQKCEENHVAHISVHIQEKILGLDHNPYFLTAASINDVLALQLRGVKIASDGGADGMWALPSIKGVTEECIEHQVSTVRWPVVLSGVFWIISMFSFIGGSWEYLKYVALLSVAFGLPSIAMKAFRTLRRLHFDVNCMMLFAALGALPLQEYTESAAVTFLFAMSETLEKRATARARGALSTIVRLRPEYANVVNPITTDIVVLPANCVAVGTSVSVRPGDKIPCDGVVIEGKSTVDEASLTGESRPVTKSTGMRVSGGTINNGNTQLVIKTTATSNDSAVSRLIRLIEDAQTNRSETEKVRFQLLPRDDHL